MSDGARRGRGERQRGAPLLSLTRSAGSTVSCETTPSFSFRRKNAYRPWFGLTSMPRCGRSAPGFVAAALVLAAGTGTCVASRRACWATPQAARADLDDTAGSIFRDTGVVWRGCLV